MVGGAECNTDQYCILQNRDIKYINFNIIDWCCKKHIIAIPVSRAQCALAAGGRGGVAPPRLDELGAHRGGVCLQAVPLCGYPAGSLYKNFNADLMIKSRPVYVCTEQLLYMTALS